jgi:hypothetical protein
MSAVGIEDILDLANMLDLRQRINDEGKMRNWIMRTKSLILIGPVKPWRTSTYSGCTILAWNERMSVT